MFHHPPDAITETHSGASARRLLSIPSARFHAARSNEPGLYAVGGEDSLAKQRSRSPASIRGSSSCKSNVARPEAGRHCVRSRIATNSTSRREPRSVDHDSAEGGSSRGRSTAIASTHAGSALRRANRPKSSSLQRFQRQWCHAPAVAATAESNARLPARAAHKLGATAARAHRGTATSRQRGSLTFRSLQFNSRRVQIVNPVAAAAHHAPSGSGRCRSTSIPAAAATRTIASG